MEHLVHYRQMKPGEESQIINLVLAVFYQFVAPQQSEEGVAEFIKHTHPDLLAERTKLNHSVIVAESDNEIIGVIETRNYSHISHFFVARKFQRQGIGRELLKRAVRACLDNNPKLAEITVNSAPNAVSAYKSLGFSARDKEETVNGIRYTLMFLDVVEFINS
ncbi:GNAT family N-acetyltransferase [Pleurocapsales cyanobacterium LEGE 10410]|nr:GNAT family N-acetyltransferase [Pleurocapsales cyanobacterium LEGE 10410]